MRGSTTGLCVLHAGEQSCKTVTESVSQKTAGVHCIVVAAISQWCRRLFTCDMSHARHFEHSFVMDSWFSVLT